MTEQINIKMGEMVSSTSQGTVSPSWNPDEGKRRQDQIRIAREEAWRQHQAATNTSLEARLERLELAFAALQDEVMKKK